MWDYDKLFANGNIIGVLYGIDSPNKTMPYTYEEFQHMCSKDGRLFRNESLSAYNVKIQYIIRLDEHGNVVEKLFDRERDMEKPMPELKTGMFVRVIDNNNMKETILGYVDVINCRIIYQDGKYNDLFNMEKLKGIVDIVEVYSIKALCFNRCLSNENLIWRSPEYQAYLDSKN